MLEPEREGTAVPDDTRPNDRDTAPARPTDDEPPRGLFDRLRQRVKDDDLFGLSAEMAFRFLFAVFPFGLFVAALAAFVAAAMHMDNPARQMIDALGDNL